MVGVVWEYGPASVYPCAASRERVKGPLVLTGWKRVGAGKNYRTRFVPRTRSVPMRLTLRRTVLLDGEAPAVPPRRSGQARRDRVRPSP